MLYFLQRERLLSCFEFAELCLQVLNVGGACLSSCHSLAIEYYLWKLNLTNGETDVKCLVFGLEVFLMPVGLLAATVCICVFVHFVALKKKYLESMWAVEGIHNAAQ